MKRRLVVIALGIASAFLAIPALTQSSNTTPIANNILSTGSVSYSGVSFSFNKSLANDVRGETVPAVLSGKPSDIVPEHPAFSFKNYARPKKSWPNDPHL